MQALVHYGEMCVGNKCLRKLLRDVKIGKLITQGWVGHIKNCYFPSL